MSRTTTYYGLRYGATIYERRKGSPSDAKIGTLTKCDITGYIKLRHRAMISEHNALGRLAQALHNFKVAYVRENLPAYTAQEPAATRGLAEGIDRVIIANCNPESWK